MKTQVTNSCQIVWWHATSPTMPKDYDKIPEMMDRVVYVFNENVAWGF